MASTAVVAIGGSYGGLEALRRFLAHFMLAVPLAASSGMDDAAAPRGSS
ncbi:hypothetical protein PQR02_37065 [Paraburkholderia sediminicola]|uniref:Uncharacterized protein n=1 Tax=Paraburkholderia rhynchosiae TaxID=487049 RepID=A0ACC7NMT0_9BURK